MKEPQHMDGDQKFWVRIWCLISVVVLAVIAVAGVNTFDVNRLQNAFRTACISKGNQYVAGNCVWSVR